MAKTTKRKVPKSSQPTAEQRMLRAHRADLRRSQRLTRDISLAARALKSAIRRSNDSLEDLRDELIARYPVQQRLRDDDPGNSI